MVSTRQMATCNGGNGSGNSTINNININSPSNNTNNQYDSSRLSIVTRRTISNYVLVNCSTIPTVLSASDSNAPTQIDVPTCSTAPVRSIQLRQLKAKTTVASITDGGTEADDKNPVSAQIGLMDLPTELLVQILSLAGYKKVAQLRMVCHKMNDICMMILNSTFSKLLKHTFNRFHTIKSSMPRRESLRRTHPMAVEADIFETCYMRLSLLQMTFGKHIERDLCCFFPGAILDEVYAIIHYLYYSPRMERPFKVTDELFDLSTMAMEYFRDTIEPTLPDLATYFNKDFFKKSNIAKRPALTVAVDNSDNSLNLPSPPQSNMVLRKGIRKIKQGMKIYNNQLSVLRTELRTCKRKSSEQGKQIAEQQKLLAEQQKTALEYANRLDENDKKNEEISRKFSTLLQELNKCKTELQYWRSRSPAITICTSCGQKVNPVTPPEDYQSYLDVILNVNDDADTESDASISGEFVYPDKTTTAKLLAVSTVTKGLKRQHSSTTASPSTISLYKINNTNKNCASISLVNETNSTDEEDTSILVNNNSVEDKVYKTMDIKESSVENFTNTVSVINSHNKDLSETVFASNTDVSIPTIFVSTKKSIADGDGFSTNVFYGTNVHKGVIVSPQSFMSKANQEVVNNTSTEVDCTSSAFSIVSDNTVETHSSEDVVTLQGIAGHETKKARRVQKATRCLNTNGKRSK